MNHNLYPTRFSEQVSLAKSKKKKAYSKNTQLGLKHVAASKIYKKDGMGISILRYHQQSLLLI